MTTLKNKLTVVVVGRSGSGKGTQARFLVQRLRSSGARHIETGSFLRKYIQKNNVTARLGRHVISTGKLFPSWFAAYAWLKEFIEHGCGDKHLVFDGAPRRIWEAELLDQVLFWHGRPPALCIYIDVTEKEVRRRLLKRGRSDDNARAIKNRLKFFREDVLPVVKYYKSKNRILRVNGDKDENLVHKEIGQALQKRLGKNLLRQR